MRPPSLVIWFFVAASTVIVGLFTISGISRPETGPGPGAPLEGVAMIIGLITLATCFAVLILCLRFRPKREAFTPRNWAFAIITYSVFVFSVLGLVRSSRYTLSARVVDSTGQPVPAASV